MLRHLELIKNCLIKILRRTIVCEHYPKHEKSDCLHDDPPFPSLLAGVPFLLMSLEMTTSAISPKRYSFINTLFSSI